MRLKSNVRFGNHYMSLLFASQVIESVFIKYNYEFVITSVNDSTHSTGSFHKHDKAFDFRSRDIPTKSEKELILKEIRESLTIDFDVLLEGVGTFNEHYHLEWQPK